MDGVRKLICKFGLILSLFLVVFMAIHLATVFGLILNAQSFLFHPPTDHFTYFDISLLIVGILLGLYFTLILKVKTR
jgi:uncharacterized membrane protein (DUF106 family)